MSGALILAVIGMTGLAACDSGEIVDPTELVTRIELTPQVDTIEAPVHIGPPVSPDSAVQLTATAFDEDDNVVSDAAFTWASSDTTALRVDSTGLAVAVCCKGQPFWTATITATSGQATAEASIVVLPSILQVIHTIPKVLVVGTRFQLEAFLTLPGTGSRPIDRIVLDAPSATFTSSDPSVLSIDGDGLATAVAGGAVTIMLGGLGPRNESVDVLVTNDGYRVESLSDLGVPDFRAIDLNNAGQLLLSGSDGPYLRESDGTLIRADPLTEAFDLNNAGEVVGWIDSGNGRPELAVWSTTALRTIEYSEDSVCPYADPFAISDAGHVGVVGCGDLFVFKDGKVSVLPEFWQTGGEINYKGWVVGGTGGFPAYAALYRDMEFIGITSGRAGGYAMAINEEGVVAGYVNSFSTVGFVYRPGDQSPTYLNSLGGNDVGANDINVQGEIVGSATDPGDVAHGILIRNGTTINLDGLLLTAGWRTSAGLKINDAGTILAQARDSSGASQTILLTVDRVSP